MKNPKIEILKDIINILNYNINEIEETNDLIHIDNLREEIKEESENFNYSLIEFNELINKIFN